MLRRVTHTAARRNIPLDTILQREYVPRIYSSSLLDFQFSTYNGYTVAPWVCANNISI
jgi:hypothetical protein